MNELRGRCRRPWRLGDAQRQRLPRHAHRAAPTRITAWRWPDYAESALRSGSAADISLY